MLELWVLVIYLKLLHWTNMCEVFRRIFFLSVASYFFDYKNFIIRVCNKIFGHTLYWEKIRPAHFSFNLAHFFFYHIQTHCGVFTNTDNIKGNTIGLHAVVTTFDKKKSKLKRGITKKSITFRIMPLVLQLHLVMISK
jgi:hypothetical protein